MRLQLSFKRRKSQPLPQLAGRLVDILLMTIAPILARKRRLYELSRFFTVPLNQNYKGLCQAPRLCTVLNKHDFQAAATQAGNEGAFDSELSILRDVFRLLPTGVTVQDEQGDFLLVNDAAAALLQMAAAAPVASQLSERQDTCLELLRTGSAAVLEEAVSDGPAKQVFLTSHRPVRIAERNLLISSSADITEQKAFEDNLFRSAYYDELTGLPTRRVIEHRVNKLLKRDERAGSFRAGLSRRRQFQAYQRLLRPRGRRRIAGRDGQAAWARPARIRHPVADQRRRIHAAAQSDPERERSRGISSTSSCSG